MAMTEMLPLTEPISESGIQVFDSAFTINYTTYTYKAISKPATYVMAVLRNSSYGLTVIEYNAEEQKAYQSTLVSGTFNRRTDITANMSNFLDIQSDKIGFKGYSNSYSSDAICVII